MAKKMSKLIVFVLVMGLTASFAQADHLWDGGGADNLWTTAANWQDDTMPPATGENAVIDDPTVGQPVFASGTYSYNGVRVGQTSIGLSTLEMTGGLLTSDTTPVFLGVGSSSHQATEGTMSISGGTMNADNGFVLACYQGTVGTLNMSGAAELNVSPMGTDDYRDHLVVGRDGNGILNMDGGTVNVDLDLLITQKSRGYGVVNMTGGTINLGGDIQMGTYNTGNRFSEFYLDGGLVTAGDLLMSTNASLDIAGGTMILNGDHTLALQVYIDDGLITGYGGTIGAVIMDYGVTNAGKTTLVGDSNFNSPPQVEAGDYQSILWPDAAQLDAIVTDDGKPTDPCAVTLTWSKTSGPGSVTFDPCNSVEDPTATFTAAGFYELQLSATDGEKDACDVVTIYVRADNNPIAHWAFETGGGSDVYDSVNNNDGVRAGDSDPNWVSGWVGSNAMEFFGESEEEYPCKVSSYVDITTDPSPDPNLDNLQYEVTLAAWFKIDDLANTYHPAIIANGHQGWRLYVETGHDEFGKVTFTLSDSLSGSRAHSTMSVDDGYWHHVVGVYDGSNSYLYVDGTLDVTVSNSGLLDTTDGVSVTIGARKRTDDLTTERSWNGMLDDVRVYSYGISDDQVANLAAMGALIPVVDAGEDQTFMVQDDYLQLDGTLTDDGKPTAATLVWSETSGPGDVDFTDTAIEDPCVTFSKVGTYVLRLTANDILAVVYDEVTITVEDPTCDDVIADGLLMASDISGPDGKPDCYVDLYDFAALAGDWLNCNDPQDTGCESPY